MADNTDAFLKQHLEVSLAFFILVLITSFIAVLRGFYRLPDKSTERSSLVFFKHLFFGFLIYLGVTVLIAPLYAKLIAKWIPIHMPADEKQVAFVSWVNIITIVTVFIGLAILVICMRRDSWMQIWKKEESTSTYPFDMLLGFLGWFIAFPVVVFVNQILEVLVHLIFDVMILPEQVAVQFLKMTIGHPFYFVLSLLSVLVFAPTIEEFLFRGLLQNWFKRYFSRRLSIFFSALCFSFFHFSLSQKLGNIPIIGSLFVLACFLGFVYERQRSLLSSITLHATFNALSVFNLIFLT